MLLVLLLAEENSKQDRPVQFLPELLETAYINFLYFLDMILQRTSSIFKQNVRSSVSSPTNSIYRHGSNNYAQSDQMRNTAQVQSECITKKSFEC